VVVSIDANKQFYVGTTKVTIEELKLRLQPFLAKESDQPSIVINADKSVPIDDVVAVMRVARELGARTVLAVDKNGAQ
jgi:biopolymer transport protein ExbD